MLEFDELQSRLGAALAANRPSSALDHVLIALPSFSLGESLLSHYEKRIPELEHRYLLAALLLHRIESCEFAFVTCQAPDPEVVDYYLSLLPLDRQADARQRLRIVEVPDSSGRAVAAKLLDRPDLIDDLRTWIADRIAFIEPWNVQADEVELAERLAVPINGTSPKLWPLGFKSSGRQLFREADVPLPAGKENLRSTEDLLEAVAELRSERPTLAGVVVKLDDSGAGDGNIVIDFREPGALQGHLDAMPDWYVSDLARGGVVEELITGSPMTSPSVQIDMLPDESVRVLATHEQVLGGASGQVYMGCRFPADPEYAPRLAEHGEAVGRLLTQRGARGRAGIDFVASQSTSGRWDLHALEINLRKGGTTHPYAVLRNLVPGHYNAERAQWITNSDGSTRAYWSTDNLVNAAWQGKTPRSVIDSVAAAGLQFSADKGTGVILHMFAGLATDGRVGLTSIGHDNDHAGELYEATASAIAHAD